MAASAGTAADGPLDEEAGAVAATGVAPASPLKAFAEVAAASPLGDASVASAPVVPVADAPVTILPGLRAGPLAARRELSRGSGALRSRFGLGFGVPHRRFAGARCGGRRFAGARRGG